MDPRIQKFAHSLVNYSTHLQPGENVLIEVTDDCGIPLAKAIIAEAYKAGANPFLTIKDNSLLRALLLGCNVEQIKRTASYEAKRMAEMDAWISVRSIANAAELGDVPAEKMEIYRKYWHQTVHGEIRVPKTKWVVMRYPGEALAQSANMSTEAFTDFYFDVCTLDYAKMGRAMTPLQELMDRTDKVHIVGKGTDLSFSIKNIPTVKCCGFINIPDGEIYTAPVRESVNGVVSYNVPSVFMGKTFENVVFHFENGKIVKAEANDTEAVNKILNADENARYIGEFAFGVNPYVEKPMKSILFDEKIAGSFHLTPGRCYKNADNGNFSSLHWDLICIQTPEYGGGEIYFDDVLIRKDGRFVLPELEGLNPEHLR